MVDATLLAAMGFAMVIAFMALIMTKRLSPLVALTIIPLCFAIVAGFDIASIGKMMLEGVKTLAPTGVMLMFAILYFGVMIDTGLFAPIVRKIVQAAGNDPLKVVLYTSLLASLVSLDGDGSTTYMITVVSMIPLYRRLGLNPLVLPCVVILANGVMNLTPWAGPLARAATSLHVDPTEVFLPMVPAMVAGFCGVVGIAWYLGLRERRRLGTISLADFPGIGPTLETGDAGALLSEHGTGGEIADGRTNWRFWFNALFTAALMIALVSGVVPIVILFMSAFAVALLINFPRLEDQRALLSNHAGNVISVIAVIFAAGGFTGILSGTGMVQAMSASFLQMIPDAAGPHLSLITALISIPFTFFMSNDAFYYGVLPILADAAGQYDISRVEIARASLIGQPFHLLSPLVPSTYLLVALAGVDFGEFQKFTFKWAIGLCLLLLLASMALGLFPSGIA